MQYLSSTDAKNNFSAMIDKVQREPVVIRKQNRDVAVMISMDDYERITRSNRAEFRAFREAIAAKAAKRGLTECTLDEILSDPK